MTSLFPRTIDNIYRGQWLGLGLFVLFIAVKLLMSVNSLINTRQIVTGADGIPIDTYGAGGAQAVLSLFTLLSLDQLVFALLGVLALARYRAMIPLMFSVFVAEHLGRRALLAINPIDRPDGAPIGLYINLALAGVLLVGLVLSLWTRRIHKERA